MTSSSYGTGSRGRAGTRRRRARGGRRSRGTRGCRAAGVGAPLQPVDRGIRGRSDRGGILRAGRRRGTRGQGVTVRVGVVTFPGSNRDADAMAALALAGAEPVALWHESPDLQGVSAVILPGGFAYGDYLRAGVIARFSPVMRAVSAFAEHGGLVLGICHGFQVPAEGGLVPGALLSHRSLRFWCRQVAITAERRDTPFTRAVPHRP